jgi:hypothetical protein
MRMQGIQTSAFCLVCYLKMGVRIGWFRRSQAYADGKGWWVCKQTGAGIARNCSIQASKAERSQCPGWFRYLGRCRHLPDRGEPCTGTDRRLFHSAGRRSIHIRSNRSHQRAQRRVCHGRRAGDGSLDCVLSSGWRSGCAGTDHARRHVQRWRRLVVPWSAGTVFAMPRSSLVMP